MSSQLRTELEKFSNSHTAKFLEACEHGAHVWEELGYDSRFELLDYTQIMFDTVLHTFVQSIDSDANEIKKQLANTEAEIKKLCNELKVDPADHLVQTGTILHRSKQQVSNYSDLQTIKTERMATYSGFQADESYLLERLGWSTRIELRYCPESPPDPIPTERTVLEYKQHTQELNRRVTKREDALTERKSSCIDILSEIEETPETVSAFASDFIYANEFQDLGDDYMTKASDVYSAILLLKDERKNQLSAMVTKISNIISRLQLVDSVPDDSDLSKSHICRVGEQLATLEELKRASLGEMIDQMHVEIEQLQKACFISELEIIKFDRQIYNKCTTKEQQLDELERRADQLKQIHTDHIELFESVHKWKLVFDELRTIEINQQDPKRLFSNRGGALLAETKRKKRLQNQLPKIEKAAFSAAERFGAHCPRLNGYCDIGEFLLSLEHEVEADRCAEREVKKAQKQHQLQQESIFGVNTSSLKRTARKPLPNSAKRTRNHDQATNASTISKTSSAKTTSTVSSKGSAARTSSQTRNQNGAFKTPLTRTPHAEPVMTTPVYSKPKTKGGFGFKAPGVQPQNQPKFLAPSSAERVRGRTGTQTRIRSGKDRRSKTPERLFGNTGGPLKAFNRLPSAGLRRRSKSVSQLNTIQERGGGNGTCNLPCIVDDSLISLTSEQFQKDLLGRSHGRADENTQPLSSSFIRPLTP